MDNFTLNKSELLPLLRHSIEKDEKTINPEAKGDEMFHEFYESKSQQLSAETSSVSSIDSQKELKLLIEKKLLFSSKKTTAKEEDVEKVEMTSIMQSLFAPAEVVYTKNSTTMS